MTAAIPLLFEIYEGKISATEGEEELFHSSHLQLMELTFAMRLPEQRESLFALGKRCHLCPTSRSLYMFAVVNL
ncbi:hypothetical protein CEXT_592061 [Caerostris extrusa]|uniref:Uncharacterized protein n=1 Tax=Caerostris extrusa TaxID=172846 RepID=A0AAV4YCI6_CAEEX|nr:hypothetical protein CEXT_592061 [Caerostris extrusa]